TGQPIPAEGIRMYPRLVLGNLVLQRRMWKLSTDVFPFRDPRHSDAEHLLRVERWRREHAIPSRVFAQIDTPDAPGEGDDPRREGRKATRKPLPVDFGSWMSLRLLEQMARSATARLVLTEFSP